MLTISFSLRSCTPVNLSTVVIVFHLASQIRNTINNTIIPEYRRQPQYIHNIGYYRLHSIRSVHIDVAVGPRPR